MDVFIVGTDTAMACGAKGKRRKGKKKDDDSPTICPTPVKGGAKCFAAGTLVHTDNGLKPIETIVPGDMVKSMDTVTGEIAYKAVTEIHTNQFDPVGAVTLLDETDGSETVLSVTASHPFYSAEGAWVHASKLKVGEKLIEDGSGTLTVTSVSFNPNAKSALTYNLTVADYHTYFVGEDGVLVHNGGGWPTELQGLMNEIVKRERDLKNDPCNLTEFSGGAFRNSRQGHRRLLKRKWQDFYRKLNDYYKNGGR